MRVSGRQAGYDWLLRFDPEIEAGYQASHHRSRQRELSWTILIGLLLYNAFFGTSILLMPDIVGANFILRFLIVTPFSLGLIVLINRVSQAVSEWLITVGMLNAFFAMVLLVSLSDAPLRSYAIAELSLILIFGAFTIGLRFRHCMLFLAMSSLGSMALISSMAELDPNLKSALRMQVFAAFVFCAYGNIQIELARVRGYVRTFHAGERANSMTRLSLTDSLTGLDNRRALELQVAEWLASPRPLSVVMIDIDHFKLYNDSVGHPQGDACLREVAAVLANTVGDRSTCLARIGGEEFAVALRGADALETVTVADRLRAAVADLGIPHPGRTDGQAVVTISVGVARPLPGNTTALSELLGRADIALYEAKRQGRNRVVEEDPIEATHTAA